MNTDLSQLPFSQFSEKDQREVQKLMVYYLNALELPNARDNSKIAKDLITSYLLLLSITNVAEKEVEKNINEALNKISELPPHALITFLSKSDYQDVRTFDINEKSLTIPLSNIQPLKDRILQFIGNIANSLGIQLNSSNYLEFINQTFLDIINNKTDPKKSLRTSKIDRLLKKYMDELGIVITTEQKEIIKNQLPTIKVEETNSTQQQQYQSNNNNNNPLKEKIHQMFLEFLFLLVLIFHHS